MIDFMHKSKRSYSQILKVKNYLSEAGIIKINKEGKEIKIILTPKGKEIINAFMNFLNVLRKNK